MRPAWPLAAILLSLTAPLHAHRLDEYLQATLLSVEKDQVRVYLRLVPGVAVSSTIIPVIDTNGDGIISDTERQIYAERVLGDLSVRFDGQPLRLRLRSVEATGIGEMREGLGEMKIEFSAPLPHGGGRRRLVFENHHQRLIAAYLVNCLAPSDKSIQILGQSRNEDQSFYQLDYVTPADSADLLSFGPLPGGIAGLMLSGGIFWLRWRRAKRRPSQAESRTS